MDQHAHDPTPVADDDASQRSGSRDSLLLTALIEIDGTRTQVRVRNLSPGGMMAELPQPVAIGSEVKAEVRGLGLVPGRVAWCTDGRIGIAFDREIDPLAARKPVGPRR
ncbi:PilZ domain-containing protein [Sphingomonas japonica]|uniref:PilZ domain-containing protein n=1 Tax=Sphingomonas japonica TaxID=511662 RepID=A0ABX0U261_9SPHN|nr:PilZ domain-containing protein [Sphingomonas japonica]NIJ24650.1 hypothetical protein [Sphingomonas japonica]